MDSTLLQSEEEVVDLLDLREAQYKTRVLYKSSRVQLIMHAVTTRW